MSNEKFVCQKAYDVSLIVPVYNVEEYLRPCIDSLLSQRGVNYEVILINDGSTDDSGAICDEYALVNPRIRVFHKSNEGISSARNKGIKAATGEYICFIDSDDMLNPDALKLLYEQAANNSQCQIIQGAHEVLDCLNVKRGGKETFEYR